MPRSASRDLADRQAGNRGYFRGWSPVERWKMILTAAALLIVVGWLAASYAYSPFDYQATKGPLASVHQAWDADCGACHRDTSGKNWFDAHGRWNDFKCQDCHSGAPHHASVVAEYANENCASCHHDHSGKNFSLVKMDDHHCIRCHDDLPKYTDTSKKTDQRVYAPKVTGFSKDRHPEFSVVMSDAKTQRHLKFSHAAHMAPGMTSAAGAKSLKKLEDIPKEFRERYRNEGQGDDALVQLDCKSCHQLEASDGSSTVRSNGAHFLPINYDVSCKACHPTETAPEPTSRGTVLPSFAVPHGEQLSTLRDALDAKFSLILQKDQPELAKHLQGKDLKSSKDPVLLAFAAEVERARNHAYEQLLTGNGCVKCHDTVSDAKEPPTTAIVPPAIPSVWMPHARFDHTSHRAMNCSDCHPAMSRDEVMKRTGDVEREPVNLPNLANCVQCHAPRSGDKGGVRHGCTDCHSYHHGDFPLQGRGSPAHAPKSKFTLENFLKGK